jgi:hypothetical protein
MQPRGRNHGSPFDLLHFCKTILVHLPTAGQTPGPLSPQPDVDSFLEWWRKADELSLGLVRKDLNSLIILGAWTLWKHRNQCVFDDIAPSSTACLAQADEERRMWELAGAKGISFLMAQLPVE